jgi:small-conductance mechanosensitive channel
MAPHFFPVFLRGLLFLACLAFAPWLAAQDGPPKEFSAADEIQKRLAAAHAEFQALPSDADPALRDRLQLLEFACQYHLAAIETTTKAKAARDEAAKATTAWRGYSQPPPYSVILLDEVRESLARLAKTRKAAETQHRIFASDLENARNQLVEHQQAERRLLDATSTGTPEDRLAAQRALQAEQVASRIADEQVARLTLRLEAQQAELDMVLSQIQLAELQLKAIEGRVIFPKADFETVLKRIADERTEALNLLKSAAPSANHPNPLLPWKIEFLNLEKSFWESRFASFNTKDPSVQKQSLATLGDLKKRAEDWVAIARIRLEGGTTAAEQIDRDQLRDSLQRVETAERLIASAIDDLKGDRRGTPVLDRIASALISFWNMELYLAEETDIIDSKKVPIYRAVTIGKLLRLAFILTVGWLILRFVSRRLNTLLARSSKLPASAAGIFGKSSFVLGLALLVLYGMNTVHIPLTVFAFLGGALAIGVGFGTQTLLKNFISGIILIFERPFKVGDSVEIEGVAGNIRSIGIRASIIRHGNGIDTLIPNSTLLENKVTNWNLSDSLLRHSITVGVDYGSPTREVSHALLAIADAHGLILKQPAPEVRFEDFGDKALVFRLLFWFDTAKTNRDTLASDLRYMIDKSFAEAGIVIAFPQREVLFDPSAPLHVELAHKPDVPSNGGLSNR